MRWDVGFDMGTENARIAILGEGQMDIPACLAYRGDDEFPFATGKNAFELIGRASGNIRLEKPMSDGVLRSGTEYEKLLLRLLRLAHFQTAARKFSCVSTCAPFARQVQQDAMLTSLLEIGATDAALVRSDAASAVGAGMDVAAPEAFLLVDIGAGKITCTLFTRGCIAAYGYIPYGLERLDEEIIRCVREKYRYAIGRLTAREIKHTLATAQPDTAPADIGTVVVGYDVVHRAPGKFTVKGSDIFDLCRDLMREISRLCRNTVSDAPEELAADLNDTGCVLAGSGALLPGLDTLLGRELGIPCRVAEAPGLCAVRGLDKMLADPDTYESVTMSRLSRYHFDK